jgi:hypothetical protein
MDEYHLTLIIQTEKPLTEAQQEKMREAVVALIDDEMLLRTHGDADLATSTMRHVSTMRHMVATKPPAGA